MSTLTRKEVEEVAMLARLHLEPDEVDRMQADLGAILDHFATLAQVDTSGIAPMTHAGAAANIMVLRADVCEPSLDVAVALRAVPKRDGDLIVVPSIIPAGES
jgi:aspartyl-tRNA(Asn)/glutamyl-tRNA(Gln) amidotransferase subunit C